MDGHSAFLLSGLVLMLTGACLAILRKVPEHLYSFLRKQIFTEVDIESDEVLFTWLKLWLAKHPYSRNARRVVATVGNKADNSPSDHRRKSRPNILFSPAEGLHYVRYNGRWLWIERRKDTPSGGDKTGIGAFFKQESFRIKTLSRSQDAIRGLLEEARDLALAGDEGIQAYVAYGDWWKDIGTLPLRTPDSLVLDGNQFEELLADCRRFVTSAQWYAEMGIPYRRGFLFYGPPGNGKTSTVLALASALSAPLYLLSLSSYGSSDSALMNLFNSIPPNSIALIEDVDSAFDGRGRDQASQKISFSGLLNAIDGAASANGRILFMSTNHREKLDPALIRPGRCDMQVYFGNATEEQCERIFSRFYLGRSEFARVFARETAGLRLSMATIQEYLLARRDNPDAAMADIQTLYPELSVAAD